MPNTVAPVGVRAECGAYGIKLPFLARQSRYVSGCQADRRVVMGGGRGRINPPWVHLLGWGIFGGREEGATLLLWPTPKKGSYRQGRWP